MEHYESHLTYLVKAERGARAERQGFVDAQYFTECIQFSSDPYEQMRYASGFEDGKAMLLVQEAKS